MEKELYAIRFNSARRRRKDTPRLTEEVDKLRLQIERSREKLKNANLNDAEEPVIIHPDRWRAMNTAPTEPGVTIEVYRKGGYLHALKRDSVDLHALATLRHDGSWHFRHSKIEAATADDLFESGVLWRPIGPLPD